MDRVHSFEPVVGTHPRVLILGTIPSVMSLQAMQYYGNPRNAFWKMMSELVGLDVSDSYENRVDKLVEHPIILWDILKACHRPGSLDSSISKDELAANDIPGLLSKYSEVRLVAFNGAASEKYFTQLAQPLLPSSHSLEFLRLPSTSPANAGQNFQQN